MPVMITTPGFAFLCVFNVLKRTGGMLFDPTGRHQNLSRLKRNTMKKRFISLTTGILTLLLFSCSKSTTETPAPVYSLEGKWTGSFNNGAGGPANYFALTFKSGGAGGALVVHANNSLTPDVANGNWTLAGDSLSATYSFTGSSAIYSLAARYNIHSNILTGTVGLSPATTGEAVFSVTKE